MTSTSPKPSRRRTSSCGPRWRSDGKLDHGPEGIGEIFQAIRDCWQEFDFEPLEFYIAGKRVLVLGTMVTKDNDLGSFASTACEAPGRSRTTGSPPSKLSSTPRSAIRAAWPTPTPTKRIQPGREGAASRPSFRSADAYPHPARTGRTPRCRLLIDRVRDGPGTEPDVVSLRIDDKHVQLVVLAVGCARDRCQHGQQAAPRYSCRALTSSTVIASARCCVDDELDQLCAALLRGRCRFRARVVRRAHRLALRALLGRALDPDAVHRGVVPAAVAGGEGPVSAVRTPREGAKRSPRSRRPFCPPS